MKNIRNIYFCAVFMVFVNSCDLIDPTEVVNPNITEEVIVGTPNSTSLWMVGMERQMALLYQEILVVAELASDNYVNTETFFNQAFDALDIRFNDADVNQLAFDISDLRNSAEVGINSIHPADTESTDEQLAELYFFKGWSHLIAGEYFKTLPAEGGGPALPSITHLAAALADFEEAEGIDGTNASYKLALARTYYALGDQANAVLKATEAISADPTFLRAVEYDAVNGPTNTMQDALQDRGNFDDLQPLPSLDFLDPKMYQISATQESPVYIQKIEEAHLILAEAAIADGDLTAANQIMRDLISLVSTRQVATFDDSVEGRKNDPAQNEINRPDTSTVVVQFTGDILQNGLVLNREEDVSIPVISGTNLTEADIDALSNEEDPYLETLYLLRQHIFIAEGRRFVDLGIKLPVSEVELLSNTNITESDIEARVPSFLPTDMDAFTYDASTAGSEICIITHNVNAILVQNKTSDLVLPFH